MYAVMSLRQKDQLFGDQAEQKFSILTLDILKYVSKKGAAQHSSTKTATMHVEPTALLCSGVCASVQREFKQSVRGSLHIDPLGKRLKRMKRSNVSSISASDSSTKSGTNERTADQREKI